ncbi:MAG: hypothetical protein ACRYFX_29455 [Janthinobacterium lividum]
MKNLLPTFVLLVCAGLLAVLTAHPAQAKIWRIDNNGGSPGNFTTLQAAFDAGSAVVSNDTLYINGSGTGYGNATVDRRVYIFGPGYFLAQNPETQASPTSATAGIITFASAASGSLLTGMSFARLSIDADNILIKRNYGSSGNGAVITVQTGRSNVLLVQNYLYNSYYDRCILVQGGCSNILIANNWMGSNYVSSGPGYAAVYSSSSVTVTQNVFDSNDVYADNSTITNNIFRSGSVSGSGNGILNNLASGTGIPAGNGNQQNVTMSDVFVGTGSDDGKWQLKAGSPALAAGANGEDCGMYGGADPYVLSGMPAIPAIWFFAAPTSGSGASGLQVHLKAKSHN